jgi:hypothetical protein
MADFHFSLFAFFLALTAVLLQLEMPGIAWIALGVAVIVAFHWFLKKAGKAGSKLREKTAKKVDEEWKKIEDKKSTAYPKLKTWDESLHALGKKSGEAIFSKDGEKFSSPKPVSRIAKGLQNFIDAFNKIFGGK